MTRKAIGKQLTYLRRDLDAVEVKLSLGKSLTARQMERLNTIRTIYEQQKYMHNNHTHSVPDRIVSVSQPFVRPIVRGKAGKPVEFGAKLDISVVDGWTRLEFCSFDAYNEAGNLRAMVEWFREREGHYPSRILADKIYRNRENLSYCRERGIRLCGPALGRPRKGETREKAQDYRDECERVDRAQVQSGKVQMRHGAGYLQTAPNCRPCHCYVDSGAESAQDSVRPFANFGHVAWRLDSTKKTGICSVEIT